MAHEKKTDPKKVVTEVIHRPKPPVNVTDRQLEARAIEVTPRAGPYYKTARAFTLGSLEREVNELAKEGYEPLGGVAVEPPDGQGHGTSFLQAMVLR